MRSLFRMILVFVGAQLLLLAVAAAIGFAFQWCIPGMDIGSGVLAGMLSTIATVWLLIKTLEMAEAMEREKQASLAQEGDSEDDSDDEVRVAWEDMSPLRRRRRRRRR